MYEAKVLEPFYNQIPTPDEREYRAEKAIEAIKMSKDGLPWIVLFLFMTFVSFFVSFVVSLIVGAYSMNTSTNEIEKITEFSQFIDFKNHTALAVAFTSWIIFVLWFGFYCNKERLSGTTQGIKSLFKVLCEKPFEIRVEYLPNKGEKVFKVIVEENQYIEGTSHVIKTKSKSITAYIDAKENASSTVKAVVEIVKKVEQDFIK